MARQASDANMLMLVFDSHVTNPLVYPNLTYTLCDFTPISRLASFPLDFAVPTSLPVNGVQEFIALAKKGPGSLNVSSAGLGTRWGVIGVGERALLAMSALVAVVSLAGLVAVVLAGLNERRRELALLRAVGARPRHVMLLLAAKGALVTLAGAALGCVLTLAFIAAAGPLMQTRFGVTLQLSALTQY